MRESKREDLGYLSPWVIYYKQIEALFEEDPEVTVKFDEDSNKIKIYVDNQDKAEALDILLPYERTFGNVSVFIDIIPANGVEEPTMADIIETAFKGNPALCYIYKANTPLGGFDYVVFENKVVQFFADNLQDINGNISTLYQDIAKEVLEVDSNVFFCTEELKPEE